MSEDTEFRDEVKRVVRRHDPDAADLRSLASDLDGLADRYDAVDGEL